MPKARFRWFVLNLPFGAVSGFVGVTLGYLVAEAKMPPSVGTALVGMSLLPHTWKFFWAPIADITLTRKKWYILSNTVSCAMLLAMAFVPFSKENLPTFELLIFINAIAISFLGMAVEGMMGATTPEDQRGTAAGWFQAGNLGGYGLGGGVALIVAKEVNITAAFATVAIITAACTIALNVVPYVAREHIDGSLGRKIYVSMRDVAKDLFKMLASRGGAVALVLCSIPLGAGALQYLFSPFAAEFGASERVVAITTGILGGVISALGCLAGGWLSDRMRRSVAYLVSGLLLAAVAALMAIAPKNVYTYILFTLLYQFAAGMCFGCFTGFVLEVIGGGAIATKYNALASLSNIPIWYMNTLILGPTADEYVVMTVALVDAAAGLIGFIILGSAILLLRPGAPSKQVS